MEHQPSRARGARVALLGVPADDRSSYRRGAAAAPDAIREAFACPSSNSSAESGVDLSLPGVLADSGDLPLGGRFDLAAIEAGAREILASGARLIALGGDHAVSHPLIRAFAAGSPLLAGRPFTILHVDAHPDLYEDFEGDALSHASPFARLMELGLDVRLVQVGIRGMNAHCRAQAERFGVEVIDMMAWERGARPAFEGDWYLSLDLDGLDPAFAPGVSHREPGGLSTREVLGLIHHAGGRLLGADIVEYNPARDLDGLTAMTAAKLLKEIAGRMALEAAR